MGLVNCFKSHVCDLANLTEPIRALLKKDTAFIWGPKQQEAVQASNQAKASISDTLCRFFIVTSTTRTTGYEGAGCRI